MLPTVGIGTWMLDQARREQAVEALHAAIEFGFALIDTAEMYGNGTVEQIVGEAICGRREQVFVVSKVLPANASYDGTLRACERSLQRMDCARIDLYLLHWPGALPLSETMRALETLVERKLVRFIGVSNFTVPELQEAQGALRHTRLACNQVLYNLTSRGIERNVLPYCLEQEIAVMAYSPLCHGEFPKPNTAGCLILEEVGQRYKRTPRQVALSFLLSHGVFAIPKSANAAHVRENCGGAGWELRPHEYEIVDRAFPAPKHDVPLEML